MSLLWDGSNSLSLLRLVSPLKCKQAQRSDTTLSLGLPAPDLHMYITHMHVCRSILLGSTRPPHAALHHCAPQYNKPCLKCINLLTTMVMCTLRGIPALLTSCSLNIVFILTRPTLSIEECTKRVSNVLMFNCSWASSGEGEVDSTALIEIVIRRILLILQKLVVQEVLERLPREGINPAFGKR